MAFSLRLFPSFACPLEARDGYQRRRSQPLVVRCAKTQKGSGIRRGGGITQPHPISPAMQKFLGVSEIPRTKAIKKIWKYIKENNLQIKEEENLCVDVAPMAAPATLRRNLQETGKGIPGKEESIRGAPASAWNPLEGGLSSVGTRSEGIFIGSFPEIKGGRLHEADLISPSNQPAMSEESQAFQIQVKLLGKTWMQWVCALDLVQNLLQNLEC